MERNLRGFAAAGSLFLTMFAAEAAFAQKQGGILKMYSPDSPASMSIHEEATVFAEGAMMGVFNNLVMYDQHVPQNSLQSIVPDLATGWSWNEDGTELTLPLRKGVTWHDGKPFTAKDVKCTWDTLTGKSSEKFRVNPRKSWYRNLEEVTTNGDYEVTFHLKQPQPAFLTVLASGFSPIYIRRFLLHVLPDGFHRIRHYGYLANGQRVCRLPAGGNRIRTAGPTSE
jgi:peptide/nickel transport system substrate-binding protein